MKDSFEERSRRPDPERSMIHRVLLTVESFSLSQIYAVALMCGVLSALALAPFFLWPVLFITLPLMICLLDSLNLRGGSDGKRGAALRRSALSGFFFGLGYFVTGLYWMGAACLVEPDKFGWAVPLAVFGLPVFFALYYAFAAFLAALFWQASPFRLLAFAMAFALVEWVRSWLFTGFSWNALGYALTADDRLMQSASLVGLDGLNFLTFLIFASPAAIICLFGQEESRSSWKMKAFIPVLSLGLLAGLWLYGSYKLSASQTDKTAYVEGVVLRLVQANIPQTKKWDPAYLEWIINRYLELSSKGQTGQKDGLQKITHLIWPEVAWPLLIAREPHRLDQIAQLLPENTRLLMGALRVEIEAETPRFYNSLYIFDHEAKIEAIFDKKHLVPFGEYLPFKKLLESLGFQKLTQMRGDFEAGSKQRFLRAQGAPHFSPLICYEILFSGQVVEPDERPGWLLNVTNDGWYGTTTGPYQHFHQSRVRAVEEGLPLVRAAGTGVSAVIDPYGRILDSIPIGQQGVIDSFLPKAAEKTVFAHFRLIPFWIFIFSCFLIVILVRFYR